MSCCNSSEFSTSLPSWMKKVEKPSCLFDDELPSYKEITDIVNKMKSSGSPCPLDQMSVIVVKDFHS